MFTVFGLRNDFVPKVFARCLVFEMFKKCLLFEVFERCLLFLD